MSEKTLIDAIKHYQKDIERCPDNKDRMLRCIKRLYVMPIKVEHLQLTGVGRSVNNLREVPGEVGDAATALVAKWKAMVTAEDMVHEEDSVPEDEEQEQLADKEPTDDRVSPDNDLSVKDKENIRLNHRTDKIKNDKPEKMEKSEKSSRHTEKHSKDSKSTKHSSKERESSSKKESSSKNHSSSSSKDKRDKDRKPEKLKELSKSEHKSISEKDKKYKDDKDKHHSRDKDKDKHSSKDKEASSKDKDKSRHSSSSSKDQHKNKVSSKDRESSKKDKSRDRSRDRKESIVKKEKRSRSPEREKESRKSEKRKYDKVREDERTIKKIKKEKLSSEEEDNSDSGDDDVSSRNSNSDNEMDHSSSSERSDNSDEERSDSEEVSEPESFSKVRIKQEPLSDSESERERSHKKSSSHWESGQKSSSSSQPKHKKPNDGREMKPPSSYSKTDSLKALIKENEKKIKKEKLDNGSEKTKKSKSKIEVNQDGSIDSGSGASFADALMGFDKTTSGSPKKKKKKEEKPKESSSRLSTVGSQSSGRSRSPSQCSTTSSYRSTSSPAKQDRKSVAPDFSKEAPEALMRKPVKLEPLNLDFSSTLPEISTNYKPLPSIQQSRHTPQQIMSEEQMFSIMTSKNQRTKVYSGYKYGHTAAVPSLYSFCIQVLYDNIDGLEYTGGVPFEILKPLLIKLNAEQLLNLEHYNPYLVTDTDDLWKFHCNKTFPKAHRDDMETWRETYLRCMDERELKLKRLTANITESMAIRGPARQAKLAYVDSVAKPPRSIARKQAKYGTGSSSGSMSPKASTSSTNISQIAAAQNQAKKKEIMSKAIVGGYTPSAQATEQVPGFSNPAAAAKILKKKKAPLMAKALQLIKGNHRFKR